MTCIISISFYTLGANLNLINLMISSVERKAVYLKTGRVARAGTGVLERI